MKGDAQEHARGAHGFLAVFFFAITKISRKTAEGLLQLGVSFWASLGGGSDLFFGACLRVKQLTK